ncbi:MAG: tetratricopeptide repeat protein [Pseudomonadota bacterium]
MSSGPGSQDPSIDPAIEQAIALHQAGNTGEAAALYNDILSRDPDNPDALRLLGVVRLQVGDPTSAEDLIRKAIALAPENAKAHDNLGLLLNATNRQGEAAAAFSQAIRLDPSLSTAQLNLGKLQFLTGQLEEARQSFQGVLHREPENRGARYYLTNILLQLGEPHAALDALDPILQDSPADAQALAFKAVALLEAGDAAAAGSLMNFDGLVQARVIDCPEGFESLEAFNRDLASYLGSHPGLGEDKNLRNGLTARGVLSPGAAPSDRLSVRALQDLVQKEFASRQDTLKEGGDHPIASGCPVDFALHGDAVKLWTGGAQAPAISFGAWFSGLYFAQVPAAAGNGDEAQQGWLELGRGRPELYRDAQPQMRTLRPEPGLLVTFPAFMWRAIRPFQGDDEHHLVAFHAHPEA